VYLQIVSLANPWLDFLTPDEAVKAAHDLNLDIQEYCSTYPEASTSSAEFSAQTKNRLFAFGSLPLVPGVETSKVLEAIEQIKALSHVRGVVMGTRGVGKGLDDEAMEPIWKALADAGLVVFVVSWNCALDLGRVRLLTHFLLSRDSQHPHYGVEGAFGEQDNGHVLALALGFPFETTIVSRIPPTLAFAAEPLADPLCFAHL
jgi:aminocarboxymuconate-semialdehyde decarboxylase